jgi:hypothetical protein
MTDDTSMSRRQWIAAFVGGSALAVLATLRPDGAALAAAPRRIVVYKDPTCGCCKAWVPHLRAGGFVAEVHDRPDMAAFKDSVGVPAALRSCHTAVTGRFVVEGHVPPADIARLLAKPPAGVVGLAVPGMPAGSPGMEVPGRRGDRYDVLAFRADGSSTVFASHG